MATRMILRNLERQPVRSLMSIIGIAFAVAVLSSAWRSSTS